MCRRRSSRITSVAGVADSSSSFSGGIGSSIGRSPEMIIILSLCASLLLMGDVAAGAFEVLPIAGGLGAEIVGVDLAGEPSDETVDAVRRAWLEHLVLFFREQSL